MRSFIGAYKVLSRVIPNCALFIDQLETAIGGLESKQKVPWTESLEAAFNGGGGGGWEF